MHHARRQEQTVERLDLVHTAHAVRHSGIIFYLAGRRNGRVAPAVILDELASGGLEGAEIRVYGVKRLARLLRRRPVASDSSVGRRPVRLIENHVGEIAGREAVHEAPFRLPPTGSSDPEAPRAGSGFASDRIAAIEELAAGVLCASVDRLQTIELGFRKAALILPGLANKRRRIEAT